MPVHSVGKWHYYDYPKPIPEREMESTRSAPLETYHMSPEEMERYIAERYGKRWESAKQQVAKWRREGITRPKYHLEDWGHPRRGKRNQDA